MAKSGCKLVMDSGQTLTVTISPEEFVSEATNQLGVMINGFLKFGDVYLNPTHVSFILPLEEDE